MSNRKKEVLENFRLDYMDVEYDMENHLKREMSNKESTVLFMNFLRRKMGLSFAFSNDKRYRPIFTDSVTNEVKRVKQVNKFKGKKKKK
jgi:hypothetical protein